ncbi:glucose-6-phosphate isomerase [Leptospira langatensis]|uniref:Glucose-6-phosphate isomerase n=1 Tax=Leptospira langatensis TaxID=2484983 RepID=A0A5F1ZVR6_9LEPT|nr:glucose-6-phosphate isomerase [Leptospira langatensis]TGK01186.1 glucose-6-phosphate isomerase [Leptospira langatensis]TGL42362.1 glucose-6-phosphate isomerase [Leptospira langatensis]
MAFALELKDRFAAEFIDPKQKEAVGKESALALQKLLNGTSPGSEFLGWVRLPQNKKQEELQKIQSVAAKIRAQSETVVVVGIGGSYLGARAVIDSARSYFSSPKLGAPEIIYAGHQLDARYHSELLKYLEGREFSVNVISKSGTTTEPALALRMLWDLAKKKYGDHAKERIVATTDGSKGALLKMSQELGFATFTIPDNVGGRYSVLTPVGLFPIAAAGIDIHAFWEGFQEAADALLSDPSPETNLACLYATYRNCFYRSGKKLEVMASYTPSLHTLAEWWKQLFGESEGKEGLGIFPASVDLTTDLHSMGQYLQEGERHLFETVLYPKNSGEEIRIAKDPDDLDGLNFLAGKKMSEVNEQALLGTLVAHSEGKVPCLEILFSDTGAKSMGQLMYFFELACGISGNVLGVNPFDQPGVEAYKKNMFALLGKPGFEDLREILKKKGV